MARSNCHCDNRGCKRNISIPAISGSLRVDSTNRKCSMFHVLGLFLNDVDDTNTDGYVEQQEHSQQEVSSGEPR